jgi:hypothetical protein
MRIALLIGVLLLASCGGGGSPAPPGENPPPAADVLDPIGVWHCRFEPPNHDLWAYKDYTVAGNGPVYGATAIYRELTGYDEIAYYTLTINGTSLTMHGLNSGGWISPDEDVSLEQTWEGTINKERVTGAYTSVWRKRGEVVLSGRMDFTLTKVG